MIIVLCTLYFNKSFINVRLSNLGEGKKMYDHQIENMPKHLLMGIQFLETLYLI